MEGYTLYLLNTCHTRLLQNVDLPVDIFTQVKYYGAEDYEVRCFEEAILKYQVS